MICIRCKENKVVSDFYESKRHKNGETGLCKECFKEERRDFYVKNVERIKANWNNERVLLYRSSERGKMVQRNYRRKHREQIKLYKKKYSKTQKHKARVHLQRIRLRKENFNYKISSLVRSRIHFELTKFGIKKQYKTIKYLGCTTVELIRYLESQFKDGMTWNNHAINGWHIDHIRPCASFDLTDPEQQKQCFHYTNLQPLWAVDNFKKGANYVAA